MACWAATPMRRRTSSAWSTTSKPATVAEPSVGLAQGGEDADGGGLAGAVVAEQPEHGAGRDVEVEVAEGPQVVEPLAEALGPDTVVAVRFVSCTSASYIVRSS